MKTIITSIILAVTTFIMSAQSDAIATSPGTSITVNVPVKMNPDKGTIILKLWTKSNFMQEGGDSLEAKIVDGNATAVFENVQPGDYAILILHDLNGNKSMDFQANRMPAENYGTSNNIVAFGPPNFEDAKFSVDTTPIEMEIRL